MSTITVAEAKEITAHADSYDRDLVALAMSLVRRSELPPSVVGEAIAALDLRAIALGVVIDPYYI